MAKSFQAKRKALGLVVNFETEKGAQTFISLDSEKEEFISIARTVGFQITTCWEYSVRNPFSRYFLGKGKVKEIKNYIDDHPEIDCILIDFEVSPSQQRNLEDYWEMPIYTKNAIIHQIFALRACTAEGKIRVELAQLQYQLSRLTGRGKQFSRTGGGIGTRGPGEQRLEKDRRKVQKRITFLNHEIERIQKQKEVQKSLRKARKVPVVAIVGYTNAGKSTLLNAITGAKVYVKDQFFATLDPVTRRAFLPEVGETVFTDTVGFIREMPPTIKEAFWATLEETKEADLILEILDVSHPDYFSHFQTINQTLSEIGLDQFSKIVVLNKVDLLSDLPRLEKEIRENDHVFISAQKEKGIEKLLSLISYRLQNQIQKLSFEVSWSELGKIEKEIPRYGYIKDLEAKEEGRVKIECAVRKEKVEHLQRILNK